MEFRQVVHSLSRSARPSLRTAFVPRQQQRLQSTAEDAARASTQSSTSTTPSPRPNIDNILQPRARSPPPPSFKPSILNSSPKNANLSNFLPPRPPRFNDPNRYGPASRSGTAPPPPTSQNPWSLPWMMQQDASKATSGSSLTSMPKPPTSGTPFTMWNESEFKTTWGLDKKENIRLSPSIGRMVHVTHAVDVNKALMRVNRLAGRNGLRNMVFQQRSHERPALKRKRKLREAWRRRFKAGFSATVARAMELRKQGW